MGQTAKQEQLVSQVTLEGKQPGFVEEEEGDESVKGGPAEYSVWFFSEVPHQGGTGKDMSETCLNIRKGTHSLAVRPKTVK